MHAAMAFVFALMFEVLSLSESQNGKDEGEVEDGSVEYDSGYLLRT